MKWVCIEHPTRGVFVDGDFDFESGGYKPRFRWSILNDEGYLFANQESAYAEMRKWPAAIRDRCKVKPVRRGRRT